MPRRELLSAAQREALLAFPDEEENLLQHYVLSVSDLAAARQHRGDHNRLGFAVQLCYLRYPGRVLAENETPPAAVLGMVAAQSCRFNRLYGTSMRGGMKRVVNI